MCPVSAPPCEPKLRRGNGQEVCFKSTLLIHTEVPVGMRPWAFRHQVHWMESNPRIVWQLAEAIPGLLATTLGTLR